ncbi:MAG TPA: hypothetical protein VNN17_08120, partial [Terriglobia bacterium]|nr:hypothetical protein [Terriglobia bacterium]
FLVGPTQFDNTLFQTAQLFPDGPNSQIPTLSGVAFSASGSQAYFGVNQESGAQIQVRDTAALRRISAFLIPEQILGGLLATSDGSYLFALTQSGLTVVNLAEAAAAPALSVSTDVLYFSAQICALEPVSRTVEITNSGSGVFTWSASTPLSNVTIEPASGTGPATLTITVDPSKLNFRGSALMGSVQIASEESVSGTQTVFLVLNIRGPDQRGVVYPVKGTFSDLLLDEARQRIYVVNTSESRIEIFSLTQQQYQAPAAVASMPKSIAFLPDRSRLLVAHYGSEYLSVLDAETLNLITRIPIPHPNNPTERPGTLPFSIAPAGGGIFLVAAAPAPPATTGTIYRVDAGSSTATAFPFLGSANNATSSATYLAASGNGAFILAAQAGGTIHLYDTATGNFAITRSLGPAISGNVAASSDGLWYFAGTQVLNSVLVQQGTIPSTITGAYTEVGFAFGLNGPEGYRSIRPSGQLPGLPSVLPPRIEKVKTDTLAVLSEFNIAESLTAGSSQLAYRVIRSMAVNPSETTLYALGVWGLMVIPLPGQSSGLQPRISPGGIVNGASFALDPAPVSPGSIASIFGTQLSTGTANASSLPLPKVLGGVCVTMEGFVAPLFAATPTQLNVQVPWELAGRATARAIVSAEGTASPPATVNLSTAAPGIFTFSSDGMGAGAILHADFSPVSIANPARIGETVSIFATGLGTVSPLIASGVGAPTDGTQHRTTATPVVTIGGVNATVSFSGLAPGFVGLYQVNVRIPSNAPVGTNIPVSIRVGANISNQA